MLEANAKHPHGDAWIWNDLPSPERMTERMPERSLQDYIGDTLLKVEALPPFVLVLPKQLKAQIIAHAGQWITQEQAGILLGRAYRDPSGLLYTVLTAALPVDDAEASIAQVKLRASSWPSLWQELIQDETQEMMGWYHSHPGYGIFLSATDRNTQNNYFSAQWQIALVVDPIRGEFGAFAGENPEPLLDSAIVYT